jgi:hypothetical protein
MTLIFLLEALTFGLALWWSRCRTDSPDPFAKGGVAKRMIAVIASIDGCALYAPSPIV